MLLDHIRSRRGGLRLYGLTPPKRGQDPVKVRDIAERQMARIAALAPDGLILYDLQDESGRTGAERPFPFLPTLEPLDYAREFLASLPVPKVLYTCVGNRSREDFLAWVDACAATGRDACVLVGAPGGAGPKNMPRAGAVGAAGSLVAGSSGATVSSGTAVAPGSSGAGSSGTAGSSEVAGLTLSEAYDLLKQRPAPVACGGVAIAERHVRKNDEQDRLLAKHAAGCSFFISQTIFDASATKSLISDYALRFAREGLEPVPLILSFSPCGSLKTMEFMKWLGISFPKWLENELRHSPDILAKSVELAGKVFEDIRAFAAEKRVPIGINVESVSIRKEEIDASCELFGRLSSALGR